MEMFDSMVAVTNTAEQGEIHPDKWDLTNINVAKGVRLTDWEYYESGEVSWEHNDVPNPYREPN